MTGASGGARQQVDLGAIEGILIERGAGSRSALRDVLWQIGVRRILQFEEVPPAGLAELASVELIMIGLDAGAPNAVTMIKQVRHRASAANPFASIFATQFEPTRDTLVGALAAGADTVLNKPLSVAMLRDRMAAHIVAARNWLVSASYIGPERPSGPGSGAGTRVAAPHVMQLTAQGASTTSVQGAVDSAWVEVARHRALHTAYQIAFRVARVDAAPSDPEAIAELKPIAGMLRDLIPRIEPSDRRFEAQVAADELLARISVLPASMPARVGTLDAAVRLAAEILCFTVGKGQADRAAAEIRVAARSGTPP
jgi:hypothetical protein